MAGRNYISPNALKPRNDPQSRRALIESPPRHRHVDDRVALHNRELQSLIVDNQRLTATHIALKQELSDALQDLRHFSAAAGKIKAERAAQVREVFEKAVKMEAEVRLIDELSADLVQVRGDVQKLTSENTDFIQKFDKLHDELTKEKSKQQQFSKIKAEIEAMHKELHKGRAAVEYEKKVYAANVEQGETMEKHRVSMAREIEKLQTDLANANKKAMAAAAASATNTPGSAYGAGFVNHDMGYGGNPYIGPFVGSAGLDPHYGAGPVPQGPYDMHHHMVNPQFAPGSVQPGPYDMQHANNPNAHG